MWIVMGRKGWTDDEIQIIKDFYPCEGIGVKSRLEGRSESQIYGIAWHYGIKNETRKKREDNIFPMRKYRKDEIEYIRQHIDTDGAEVVAKKLGRTVNAIRSIASKEKQKERGGGTYSWTSDEIEIIKKYYPIEGIKVRNRLKGRTDAAIYSEASHVGVAHNKRVRRSSNSAWTKDEDAVLTRHYQNDGVEKCCELLPLRSRQAIVVRANRYLGLKRDRSGSSGNDTSVEN